MARKLWKYRTTPFKPNSAKEWSGHYLHKRYRAQKSLEYKARTGRLRGTLLDSGFYEGPTWNGLIRAWLAYVISCKEDNWERRKYYAAVIQKLEGELGIKKYDFEEIRGLVADYLQEYQDDPDVQDMTVEEIEEVMNKSDNSFWREVNG